jgi:hypothetical protein
LQGSRSERSFRAGGDILSNECRFRRRRAGFDRGRTSDDWERRIPEEQLFTGKDLSIQIEQDTGKIRHDLARFRRRAVSNCPIMADLSPRLHRHLRGPKN